MIKDFTPEDKIAYVVKSIVNDAKISPNPKAVEYIFNDNFYAPGLPTGLEERKIIRKLASDGYLRILDLMVNPIINGHPEYNDLRDFSRVNLHLAPSFEAFANGYLSKKSRFKIRDINLRDSKLWRLLKKHRKISVVLFLLLVILPLLLYFSNFRIKSIHLPGIDLEPNTQANSDSVHNSDIIPDPKNFAQ